MFRRNVIPALTLLAGLAVVAVAADDKPDPQSAAASEAGSAVERMMQAQDLAEYGRKNKAPEALITAAGILRRFAPPKEIKTATETRNEKDEVIKPEDALPATFDLLAPAEEMLKDAKKIANDLVAIDKKYTEDELAAVQYMAKYEQKQIDKVRKDIAEKKDERLCPNGVHSYRNIIRPGTVDVYKVQFIKGVPARVAVQNSSPVPLRIEVRDPDGNPVFAGTSLTPGGTWIPTYTQNRNYTIRLRNVGNAKTMYQLLAN